MLSPPVVSRRVPPNSWIESEIRAMPAARFPSLAIKRMGAMTTEQPGIMKRQNHRYLLTQPGDGSQAKISTMQIVTVNDIWSVLGKIQKCPTTRETKVFKPEIAVQGVVGSGY